MAIKSNPFGDDETLADAPNSFLRFMLPSILVMMLLTGGVYWIRQLPASPRPSESGGNIQVRLLQTPEATPMPLRASDQPTSPSVGVQSEQPREPSEEKVEDVPPSPAALATASVERAATPNVNAIQASTSSPPTNIAVKFQQALMHWRQ